MASASSFLQPPNSYALSDAIVGNVMQRTDSRDSRFNYIANHRGSASNDSMQMHRSLRLPADVLPTTEIIEAIKKNPVAQKRLTSLNAIPASPRHKRKSNKSLQSNEREEHNVSAPTVLKNRKRRCRVLCRLHEARYRERRRRIEEDLKDDIQKLKEGVCKLEAQRQRIGHDILTNEAMWRVVMEYFKVFRHGYVVPRTEIESPAIKLNPVQCPAQLKFLQATMVLDMPDGTLCGVDALLENWRLLSLYHKNLHVQLKCLEQGPGDSLVATTTTSLTITENTLRNVYPHLLTNTEDGDEGKQWSPLAVSLLNQRLVVPGTVRFDWDVVCSRVVRMESTADMLTPILRLVGSLEDVAQVFDGAFVTPELRMTRGLTTTF